MRLKVGTAFDTREHLLRYLSLCKQHSQLRNLSLISQNFLSKAPKT